MFSIVIIIVYDDDGVLTIHGLVMNDLYGIMIVTTIIVVFYAYFIMMIGLLLCRVIWLLCWLVYDDDFLYGDDFLYDCV